MPYCFCKYFQTKRDMCGLCTEERNAFEEINGHVPYNVQKSGFLNVSIAFPYKTMSCAEFRICDYPSGGSTSLSALKCARQKPLFDETGSKTMFHFEANMATAELRLKIPTEKMSCSRCVLQLKYLGGE